ncbi:MAG: glycosyltransferase family 4 protein [Candidatus Tectomicrobia bacterium]|nr:glycosyltransferase family 4 protein [Candidatus Tectomicrobia bacterium]
MKVVQLDSQLAWRGGEQQVLYLSQALRAHGYDNMTICPPHSALYQRTRDAGLPAYGLRMHHELDLIAAWKLGRYLQRQQVDILHMHAPHAHTIGLLACVLAPRVRQVVSRRVDFAPIRNRFSRWKYGRPQVQYLTVSNAVRQVMLGSGIPDAQVQTIHSGIDLKRCEHVPDASPLFSPGTRVIGTVGHLAGHKGHRYLLDAMQLILQEEPSVGLAIAGTGDLREELEAQAEALGITQQVCFTGFRHDILSFIRDLEIFVFPSNLEGLGTSVLDAMALGKPVVATQAGGIPEMVQDGVTGLLVPPRDPKALAQAILQLLRQPTLSTRFGEAGAQRVKEHFTAERMASQTMQVYRQLVDDSVKD